MTATTYLLYLAAVVLLVITPGPTMLMSVSNAALYGTRRALVSTAGSVSAVLIVMLLSSLGLGAILATSEWAFTVLKMLGAAYLIYLGLANIRSATRTHWFNRVSGSMFVAMGALLLLLRRPT